MGRVCRIWFCPMAVLPGVNCPACRSSLSRFLARNFLRVGIHNQNLPRRHGDTEKHGKNQPRRYANENEWTRIDAEINKEEKRQGTSAQPFLFTSPINHSGDACG